MLNTILAISFSVAVCSVVLAAVQSVFVVRPLLADAGVAVGESRWGWLVVGYPIELFEAFTRHANATGLSGFTVWHARWYVRIQVVSWLAFAGALFLLRTPA